MRHRHGFVPLFLLTAIALAASLAPLPLNIGRARAASTQASPVAQLIVRFKAPRSGQITPADVNNRIQALSSVAGTSLSYGRLMSGGEHVLRLPAALPADQAEQIAARLRANPDVDLAEPDYVRHTMDAPAQLPAGASPNDPFYSQQWNYGPAASYGANLQGAWEITTGDPNLVVAVIDTGIRLDHPDLIGRTVPGGGYDFISDATSARDGSGRDSDPSDMGDWNVAGECGGAPAEPSSWHGTHVAGTIGAASDNGVGVTGINWRSKLLILRALGKCGGTDSDIIDAIRWAAGIAVPGVPNNTHPARVINMSLGGYSPSCPASFQSAINDATAQGTVVVVAAGNESANASSSTPANCQNVIAVGATGRDGDAAFYSNYGAQLALSAPGGVATSTSDPGGILSTLNAGATTPGASTYKFYQGTSMATPHVAGVASLILSVNPSLTPAQVKSILMNNVTPFAAGWCTNFGGCGTGILNAAKAVQAAAPTLAITNDPPGALLGVPYSFQFAVVGGQVPSFSLQSGTLPPGLALSAQGAISGTPTQPGLWQLTVLVANSGGGTATRTVSLRVSEPLFEFVPLAVH